MISVTKAMLHRLEGLNKDWSLHVFTPHKWYILTVVYTKKKVWNSKRMAVPKQRPSSKDWEINEHLRILLVKTILSRCHLYVSFFKWLPVLVYFTGHLTYNISWSNDLRRILPERRYFVKSRPLEIDCLVSRFSSDTYWVCDLGQVACTFCTSVFICEKLI